MVVESDDFSFKIGKVAIKSGADPVGFVSAERYDDLPRVWIGWSIQSYTKKAKEILSDARTIIVIAHHVWDDMLKLAIRKGSEWVYPGYLQLSISGLSVIQFP